MGVEHTFHPNVKVAHRGDPSTTVRRGNHDAETKLPVLRSWYPIEVLHFPLRTLAQAEVKFTAWQPVLDAGVYVATHVDTAVAALRAGRFGSYYERYVVDDQRLADGLRDGSFSVDTRLRDALRELTGEVSQPLSPSARLAPHSSTSRRLEFPSFDLADEAALADDVMSLADSVDRAQRRVEGLEDRLVALERPLLRRMLAWRPRGDAR
jgi:hypothetical protein